MKVIVFPLRDNPYQKYLYDEVEIKVGKNNIFFFLDINTSTPLYFIVHILQWPFMLSKIRGPKKIFHLHWQFFYFLIHKKVRTIPSVFLALWLLSWVKIFGYKIIWTVHDYTQHDTHTTLDYFIRKITIFFADGIIVLNNDTKKCLMEKDKILPKELKLIPLGNYGTDFSYKENSDKNIIKFCFFGLVRKYKGIERLIHVFKTIKGGDLRLNIVGDCYSDDYYISLKKIADDDSRISIQNKYLSKEELALFVHSSHCIVLPFLEVTNSSSAMLAYSKGRPVIAPLIGAFNDHPENVGFFYSPNTDDQLKNTMESVIKNQNQLPETGRNALAYAKSFNWSFIAQETIDYYNQVLY